MPTATAPINVHVSPEQVQQFQTEGYMILERIIPDDMLEMLGQECSYFIGYEDGRLDERGETVSGITHRGSRYFVANKYRLSHRLNQFLFSSIMAEVARAALGDDVWLFHEQWVVKGPEQGMKFSWHQDSGYVGFDHKPYLTCWCALDDVTEENGTVYLLPHSRGGTKGRILDHAKDENTNDKVGYTGDDPGIVAEVPAGSIVAFDSYVLHSSGSNSSDMMRRVYLPQYSAEPIIHPQGKLHAWATPFVRDGRIIYDPKTDKAGGYPACKGDPA